MPVEKRLKNVWIPQDEHYLATILHPNLKHFQMGVPGDKEKAVQILRDEIEKWTSQQVVTPDSSHVINVFSPIALNNASPKTPERKNLLAQCFDRVLRNDGRNDQECDNYLSSPTTIGENDDDDGDGMFSL